MSRFQSTHPLNGSQKMNASTEVLDVTIYVPFG